MAFYISRMLDAPNPSSFYEDQLGSSRDEVRLTMTRMLSPFTVDKARAEAVMAERM
jgi:hypothetical protein